MENFEETLEHRTEEELQELKSWLFRENIRLSNASKDLEQMQEQFLEEKMQFLEEMKLMNSNIAAERQRLKEDTLFFERKMEILKNGFSELDIDRRRLDKDWAKLAAEKAKIAAERDLISERKAYIGGSDVSVFFQGVRNPLALKKRYKDLIKIFHPDNMAGDKEIIQRINKEYENLKGVYEDFKQA